jgi:hypothetical protein
VNASFCSQWGEPVELGQFNQKYIDEASGLAISSQYEDRAYHINDSGDGPYFYQTNFAGKETKKIAIDDFKPVDVEDLAYGDCGDKKCLIIADVGDNAEQRDSISFIVIEETKEFKSPVTPRNKIIAKYPDRPHNVEGVAIHPSGDVYILTKEVDIKNRKARPAQLFLLKADQWKQKSSEVVTLESIGSIDFPYHLYEFNLWGRLVTALDISQDGKKLLVLTYKSVVEMNLDPLRAYPFPNSRELQSGKDFKVTELSELPQQEAIAYIPGENAFIFNTEYKKRYGRAPIYKMSCIGK